MFFPLQGERRQRRVGVCSGARRVLANEISLKICRLADEEISIAASLVTAGEAFIGRLMLRKEYREPISGPKVAEAQLADLASVVAPAVRRR